MKAFKFLKSLIYLNVELLKELTGYRSPSKSTPKVMFLEV